MGHWFDEAVPRDQEWLVTGLQTQLENSVSPQTAPDPSVLIALDLAEDQNFHVKKQLIQQLKETATKEMTSGKVALYVLALQSSCENLDITIEGENVNLVHLLEEKTKEEIKQFSISGIPKTTFYQLALDALALCVEKSPDTEMAAIALAKAALANHFEYQGHFSVDTAAMASLALTCVYDGMITKHQSKIVGVMQEALVMITKRIIDEQRSNGIIGNIYSTGLAMQALSVTSEFYSSGAWSCMKTLNTVLREIYQGAFTIPATASQILPSLVGKTYLDVKDLTCSSQNVPIISVKYTIINNLVGPYFNFSITVNVTKGSVLLEVLEVAQQKQPMNFSFQTEQTSQGTMVVSIHDINASTNEKTYWQFFSGKRPLEQGVGSYKPADNEQIEAIFSSYGLPRKDYGQKTHVPHNSPLQAKHCGSLC
ncbi:cobalamin binding intrinsic factor [Hemicordylus capensis]|uniref:cobalamin binding intrinsic factor n=1 Tax=Hemicordylus capensis TaxID=884348 RepID=UPI002302E7E2|nr:cobalamin binding intrinsic factor [Hemicordylus capensis]